MEKSIVIAKFGEAMIRAKYKQYIFTLFPDGRVIFQDINKNELEEILEEIFGE